MTFVKFSLHQISCNPSHKCTNKCLLLCLFFLLLGNSTNVASHWCIITILGYSFVDLMKQEPSALIVFVNPWNLL